MSRVAVVLAAGVAGAVPVTAQVLHDIPWYMTNGAERAATLRLCRSDTGMGRLPDCANAEQAETRLRARSTGLGTVGGRRIQTPAERLQDPAYWASNRIARAGMLAECASPIPEAGALAPTARECAAARQGEAADGNWVARHQSPAR